jgi:DNA-binding transcriptional LysR family regulator
MMISTAITLDQLRVFRQVALAGSFSAAARALHRAQSAITYAVQNLEEQVGSPLFDRSGYRPVLNEAGRALLPRAERILEDLASFNAQARSIAGGLEPEVSLVVDPTFPTPRLVRALAEFQQRYPSVLLRVYVETLGAAAQTVLDGTAELGITLEFASDVADLEAVPIGEVELVPVVAPSHPLAAVKGKITVAELRDHVQLVLSDRSTLTRGKEFSVFSVRTWRLADLGARHELLRAGLGWGSMPIHMVEEDLAQGRLVKLDVRRPDGLTRLPRPVVVLARRRGKALGPAGEWLAGRLAQPEAARAPKAPRKDRTRKAPR